MYRIALWVPVALSVTLMVTSAEISAEETELDRYLEHAFREIGFKVPQNESVVIVSLHHGVTPISFNFLSGTTVLDKVATKVAPRFNKRKIPLPFVKQYRVVPGKYTLEGLVSLVPLEDQHAIQKLKELGIKTRKSEIGYIVPQTKQEKFEAAPGRITIIDFSIKSSEWGTIVKRYNISSKKDVDFLKDFLSELLKKKGLRPEVDIRAFKKHVAPALRGWLKKSKKVVIPGNKFVLSTYPIKPIPPPPQDRRGGKKE